MSGPLFIGQQLQDALDTNNLKLMSSDGNEGSLESNQLVSELQSQGLNVSANTPSTTCAAFNAGVCDIQTPDYTSGTDAPSPVYDNNNDYGLG